MSVIAWIGLGHMGVPMAANLVAGGHTVRGYDISPVATAAAAEHGVIIAASVADALDGADACLTSLPMPAHVRAVYEGADGIWAHAAPETLLLDTSTVDVETSRWCHDESARRGFAFVDSPVSGGTAGAEAHTLTFMLGGDPDAVTRARDLVTPMAGSIIACGGPTTGIAAKLVNNMMLFVGVMAAAEGSQLAERLGLDPRVFYDVASVSSGGSWPQRTWYPVPGVVPGGTAADHNFDATFSVDLARKDCALAVQAGLLTGVHVPAATLALSQLDELTERGLGHKDCTLVTLFASPDGTLRGYHPSSRSVEIELKFEVDASTPLPDWTRMPGVARAVADDVRDLDALYLDTDDTALGHARYALRRRTGGPDAGWHLKGPRLPDGGRIEVQWELGDGDDVPEGARAAIADITRAALIPLARIRSTRTPYLLLDAEGAVVAEFVDDLVTTVDERTGREQAWREWEFELGPAAPDTPEARAALLAAATDAVAAAGGRPADADSKLARALGVVG